MKSLAALLVLLIAGCASAPEQVVAFKRGLTITVLNPFDCSETTRMQCYERSLLTHECRCRS